MAEDEGQSNCKVVDRLHNMSPIEGLSFLRTVVLSDDFMDCLHPLKYSIDKKIVFNFITRGHEINRIVRATGQYRQDGDSEGKYLIAHKECRQPDDHNSKFYICFSACIYCIVPWEFHLERHNEDEYKVIENFPRLQFEGQPIRNPLADLHGIPPTTDLYYIYNICLPTMLQRKCGKGLALLLWREMNKDVLLVGSAARIVNQRQHDWEMKRAYGSVSYHARQSRASSVREYIESRIEQLKPTLNYLDSLPITAHKHEHLLQETLNRFYALEDIRN